MEMKVESKPSTATHTVSTLKEKLEDYIKTRNSKPHLMFSKSAPSNDVLDDELTQLQDFAKIQNPFPFKKLSIELSKDILKDSRFLECLKALNATPSSFLGLQFIFPESEILNSPGELCTILTNSIAPLVNYPIQIRKKDQTGEVVVTSLSLKKFEAQIITKIQEKNRHKTKLNPQLFEDSKNIKIPESLDPLARLFKFKDDIATHSLQKRKFQPQLEVVEFLEEEVALQAEMELELQAESIDVQNYMGKLIDFKTFSEDPIYQKNVKDSLGIFAKNIQPQLYALLENELFANLPQSVKYLSPDAALKLSNNLRGLVTLNKENTPGFSLKKTEAGEYLLDYEFDANNEKNNAFTPEAMNESEVEPIYEIDLPEELVKACAGDDNLFHCFFYSKRVGLAGIEETQFNQNNYSIYQQLEHQLTNLWIKYGDQGLIDFFNILKKFNKSGTGGGIEFIYKNYLAYLPQWDHLLDAKNFLDPLTKIAEYDSVKCNCLLEFLENTGSSGHCLNNTVAAFELFWDEFNLLCAEKGVDLKKYLPFNFNWDSLQGGNPVVYMERLLFILKNADNLEEQLKYLNGLTLDNYGAYYAAKYENFKLVAPFMSFVYKAEEHNKRVFSADFNVYRVSLDHLVDFVLSPPMLFDYLDFLKEGADKLWLYRNEEEVSRIEDAQFKELIASGQAIRFSDDALEYSHARYKDYFLFRQTEKGEVLCTVSYKQWASLVDYVKLKGGTDYREIEPEDFPKCVARFLSQQSSTISYNALMNQLHEYKARNCGSDAKMDIHLVTLLLFVSHDRYTGKQNLRDLIHEINYSQGNQVLEKTIKELYRLYKLDVKLNEDEGLYIFSLMQNMNSSEFEHHKLDKDDQIKKLFHILEHNKYAGFKLLKIQGQSRVPLIYAFDTAEFLTQDAPLIAETYRDDLLFFTKLLSGNVSQAYCHSLEEDAWLRRKATDERFRGFKALRENPEGRIDKAGYEENIKNAVQIKENLKHLKSYFSKAVDLPKPNNFQFSIKVLLDASEYFTYNNVLAAMNEIDGLGLGFNPQAVKEIFTRNQLKTDAKLSEFFSKGKVELKQLMIELIIELEQCAYLSGQLENAEKEEKADIQLTEEELKARYLQLFAKKLSTQSFYELGFVLKNKWAKSGSILALAGQMALSRILDDMKKVMTQTAFDSAKDPLLSQIAKGISSLPEFQDHSDFDKLEAISDRIAKLSDLFTVMLKNPYVVEHKNDFIGLFQNINFSQINYLCLLNLLTLLMEMPQRNYLLLIQSFFSVSQVSSNQEKMLSLIEHVTFLNRNSLPTPYLVGFSDLFNASQFNPEQMKALVHQILSAYMLDNKDPLLEFVMTKYTANDLIFSKIMSLSHLLTQNRDKFSTLLLALEEENHLKPFLDQFDALPVERQTFLIEILSKGFALQRSKAQALDFNSLIQSLNTLPLDDLRQLHAFYATTPLNLNHLTELLNLHRANKSLEFKQFLLDFERIHFSTRSNLPEHFDCSQVDRVINSAKDLVNNRTYLEEYKAQLKSAFLYVNQIGKDLAVFNNKSALELTNAELATELKKLKNKSMPYAALNAQQRQLMILGLLREAMFRSTGEFPYSTQMINIIDGVLHSGNLISNVDTGQGKSLIDFMKAAFLWADAEDSRVEIVTSSLIDAKRDIGNYGPFLKLLDIPFSEKAIHGLSPIKDFQKNGINITTSHQVSLFFDKAKVMGINLDNPDTKISLVLNESDYTLLDDHIIHRLASSHLAMVGAGQEWIYYAINKFIDRDEFINNKMSIRQNIDALKAYLKLEAQERGLSKFLKKFEDSHYLSWLESALIVKFQLRVNKDYVIVEDAERKIKKGVRQRSKAVKILMNDGKVSPDSVFGNGIQQLLYARLNTQNKRQDFVIEPQYKTIISSNNKNLIDYYRSQAGRIWGSSGTVGSAAEVAEQFIKYGFDCSKIDPHQINQVKHFEPSFLANAKLQKEALVKQLSAKTKGEPNLVFCKNIDTATDFYNYILANNPQGFPVQIYTGVGDEKAIIQQAAIPGMITITTSALGRNTDIPYDKALGLNVWQTFVDSTRKSGQKNGRTGRQGSKGEIHYLLNLEDMNGQSIEPIRKQLDEEALVSRNNNELLYDILGYLLTAVHHIPAENFPSEKTIFYREIWSKFSVETETKFHEANSTESFNKQRFINEVLAGFNEKIKTYVNPAPKELESDVLMALEKTIPGYLHCASFETTVKRVKPSVFSLPFNPLFFLSQGNSENESKKLSVPTNPMTLYSKLKKVIFHAAPPEVKLEKGLEKKVQNS